MKVNILVVTLRIDFNNIEIIIYIVCYVFKEGTMNKCNKINDIGLLIKLVDNRIKKVINKNLVRFNLTATQEKVMWIIFRAQEHEKDVFQKDIENELDLSNPTVTGIVKRLEEKDMIKRVPSSIDARYKCLTLTDRGLEVIHECMDFGVNYIEKKLTKNMTEDELRTLRCLLNRVIDNMDE